MAHSRTPQTVTGMLWKYERRTHPQSSNRSFELTQQLKEATEKGVKDHATGHGRQLQEALCIWENCLKVKEEVLNILKGVAMNGDKLKEIDNDQQHQTRCCQTDET